MEISILRLSCWGSIDMPGVILWWLGRSGWLVGAGNRLVVEVGEEYSVKGPEFRATIDRLIGKTK